MATDADKATDYLFSELIMKNTLHFMYNGESENIDIRQFAMGRDSFFDIQHEGKIFRFKAVEVNYNEE